MPSAARWIHAAVPDATSVSLAPRFSHCTDTRRNPMVAPPVGQRQSLWTNADDRLPVASLGRVEGGDSIVERRDVADVGAQSSVAHALDDLAQLGTIGLDDEVDCQAVRGP